MSYCLLLHFGSNQVYVDALLVVVFNVDLMSLVLADVAVIASLQVVFLTGTRRPKECLDSKPTKTLVFFP